jgi:prepilin-type N-terminal cleavage/methylation domain-containing protein
MNNGSQRVRAFTLVEVLVVVGILAMVLAMGMPAFVQVLRKEPLRKAASDVMEGCTQARARAILGGKTTELVIEGVSGRIYVTDSGSAGDSTSGEEAAGEREQPAQMAGVSSKLQEQLDPDVAITLLYVNLKNRMDAEEARVKFFPNGTSDDFTIVLESSAGTRKVSLDCITALPDLEIIR